MGNNNNVCRFCFKLVCDANVELINEATQKILEVLLIKLNLDVSENPLACKMCLGILDEINMFKSKCLYSEDIINTHFESNLKVSLMDILIELESEPDVTIAEGKVVCRLCIKIPPNGSYIALNKTSEEVSHCRYMMQMQLPEIKLNITKDPIICGACHALLKNYYSFATSCMDVEQKIKMFCEHQGNDVKGQVDLSCVLQFTENKARGCANSFNGDLVVNQKESNVHFKVEKIEGSEKDKVSKHHFTDDSSTEFHIKEEEVEIKSELDQISCDQCTYSTHVEDYLLRHKHMNHMGQPKIMLPGISLDLHKKTRDSTKHTLNCEQCEYSTYNRSNLKRHLMTHKTVVYYCATCDFNSTYKHSLRSHIKSCLKKETDDTDSRVQFHCSECDFRGKCKSSLNYHKKTHDPTRHKFKCEQCEYSTYIRSSLKQHLVTHMELGETKVYDCAKCDFKSKYKKGFNDHIKRCSKEKDLRVALQCNQCYFHTKCGASFSRHKKVHDPNNYKFKCEKCKFSTYIRSSLDRHLMTHMELGETTVYYCAKCDFKTKYKGSLIHHMKRCSKNKDKAGTDSRVMLQCNQCYFFTKCKRSLISHKKSHKPPKQKFKCDQCEFSLYHKHKE